jgi:hypothetical protein
LHQDYHYHRWYVTTLVIVLVVSRHYPGCGASRATGRGAVPHRTYMQSRQSCNTLDNRK